MDKNAKTLFDIPRPRSRADQIKAHFIAFHKANPGVWRLFKGFAFQVIAKQFTHYSSRTICHRIRWHADLQTKGDSCKINDHYSVYYGRMFEAVYPDHKGFFCNRRRKSEDKPAAENDRAVFDIDQPGDEEQLYRELAQLGKLK